MEVQPPDLTCPQSFYRDRCLSWQARGILAYIIDHGPSWVINVQHLIDASANDGRCVVQSALRELVTTNYLTIHTTRDSHGHVCGKTYRIADKQVSRQSENQSIGTDKQENRPTENLFFGGQNGVVADYDRQTENQSVGSPTSRFSDNRETGSITKKDLKNKTKERKKEKDKERDKESSAAIEVLAYLNTIHGHTFQNSTQIQTLLRIRPGVTIEDCKLVIDWLYAVERIDNPGGYERYGNNVTPFRPQNFDINLNRARHWKQQCSESQQHQPLKLVY